MLSSQEDQNLCVYCCNLYAFRCEKCSDPYCSKKCQLKDWTNHRYICFAIPNLKAIAIEKGVINSDSNEKESESELQKSTVNDNKSCISETLPHEQASLTLQDTVIGSFLSSEAEIELCELIKDIKIDLFENEKNLKLNDHYNKKEDKTESEHKENNTNLIVNTSDSFFMMKNLKIHEWPKTKNIKVTLQNIILEQSKTVISFVEDKKLIEDFYEFMENKIEKYVLIAKKHMSYLPRTNEVVLGYYDGRYRRACVLDPEINGVIVLLIDYGDMVMLNLDEILPIEGDAFVANLSFEVCSRQFIVDNFPKKLDEKQEEILESKKMMITNVNIDKTGIYHCEIFGF